MTRTQALSRLQHRGDHDGTIGDFGGSKVVLVNNGCLTIVVTEEDEEGVERPPQIFSWILEAV